MAKRKSERENVPICVLLPVPLRDVLRQKVKEGDLTLSQIVRRAIRKELEQAETTR